MATAPAFASAADALEVVRAGLRFVAAADATQMAAAERVACLRALEKADAAVTAARTSVLAAFGAGQDYIDDGDYSPFSWLLHRTQVTRGTAAEHTAWVKRSAAHPAVHAALVAEAVSVSYAREICTRSPARTRPTTTARTRARRSMTGPCSCPRRSAGPGSCTGT